MAMGDISPTPPWEEGLWHMCWLGCFVVDLGQVIPGLHLHFPTGTTMGWGDSGRQLWLLISIFRTLSGREVPGG